MEIGKQFKIEKQLFIIPRQNVRNPTYIFYYLFSSIPTTALTKSVYYKIVAYSILP